MMVSLKDGFLDKMQENAVSFYTGYVQIHQNGYWDDQNLDNTLSHSPTLADSILTHSQVTSIIPRLEAYGLAASEKRSRVSMVVGIDPDEEQKVTRLKEKVVAGEYIVDSDKAVLLTEGLADYLNLNLGDTIVILGQGYHGISAVGKYLIKGLIKFGSPDLNNRLVYLPIAEAQWLYGAENRLTAYVLEISDGNKAKNTAKQIQASLGSGYEVMPWQVLLPELNQMIQGEDQETVIFLLVLYILISFGIFGTFLMMTMERKYEFGMVVALGMKKYILSLILVIEGICVTMLGALSGLIISFPIINYLHNYPIQLSGELAEVYENYGIEPIFYFSMEPYVFYSQALIVLILALVLSTYPVLSIFRLKPVNAMRE
jgi:ABC-type lipoprotein release transport system permease subunit